MSDKSIVHALHKLKEAKKNQDKPKITGVENKKKVYAKKKRKKGEEESTAHKKHHLAQTGTGPRGGSYFVTSTGRKVYSSSKVKKGLEQMSDINKSIEKFKELQYEKAVEAEIKKSLFPKEELRRVSSYQPSEQDKKEYAMYDLPFLVEKLAKLDSAKWVLEQEFPDDKDVFEKLFKKIKKEIQEQINILKG